MEKSAQSTITVNGKSEPWRYLLHLPSSYSEDTSKQWPLLIFLHGKSIRGRDLDRVKRYGPPQFLDKQPDFPFVVVSPQLPDGSWPADDLADLLDEVIETYEVDEDRVYLTGTSLGAQGAWVFASSYPDKFAAFAPVCGHGWPSMAEKLTDLPIRAFHGTADKIIPIGPHRELVSAINRAGGKAKMVEIKGGTHGSVIFPVYEDETLYEWFLTHRR